MAFEFLSNLRSVRNTVGAIDKKLTTLRAERAAVAASPPHTSDIQAWALRGLDNASESFLGRLRRWHFNDEALAVWSGETLDAHAGAQLLAVSPTVPSHKCPAPGGQDSIGADFAAVTHFLRPAIEAALPKLIEESFPGSRNGMKGSDRRAKLERLDKAIAALEAERASLADALKDAQKAIDAPANTHTGDDVAAAEAAAALAAGEVINPIG